MFKNAKWIWINNEDRVNEYGEFLGKIRTQGGAKIKISCDGDYALFINGDLVSSNQYGDFEHYKSVDTVDISAFLTKEENTLALLVWHLGVNSSRYKRYAPGVIFEVEHESGDVILYSCSRTPSQRI